MNRDEDLWERTPFEHTDQDESVVPWGFPQSATHPLTHQRRRRMGPLAVRASADCVEGGVSKNSRQVNCWPAVEREEAAGWMHVHAT